MALQTHRGGAGTGDVFATVAVKRALQLDLDALAALGERDLMGVFRGEARRAWRLQHFIDRHRAGARGIQASGRQRRPAYLRAR